MGVRVAQARPSRGGSGLVWFRMPSPGSRAGCLGRRGRKRTCQTTRTSRWVSRPRVRSAVGAISARRTRARSPGHGAVRLVRGSAADRVSAFSPVQIVWDEKKNRWVDTNEPEEEVRGGGGLAVPGRGPASETRSVARPGLRAQEQVSEAAVPPQKKAPPPPPVSLPKAPQAAAPGPGGPPRASVNMFSRKAGNRAGPERELV